MNKKTSNQSKQNAEETKEIAHEIKRAKKGSGAATTKGARRRTEIGLSKGMNKGGAQGTAHNGEVKPRQH